MPLVLSQYQVLQVLGAKRTLFNTQRQIVFLYTNNRVPTVFDTLADYTAASYHGATGIRANWPNPPALDGAGGGLLQADSCIFTPSSGGWTNSVYGYFVIDFDAMELLWAERFAGGPYNIGADTEPITVVPTMAERSIA